MVKLVALAITALLFVFGQPVFGVISLIILLFVSLVLWVIKSNKQQPGESDEDYAKRIKELKMIANENVERNSDPFYKPFAGNFFHK